MNENIVVRNVVDSSTLQDHTISIIRLGNLMVRNIGSIKSESEYYASDVISLRPIEASGMVLITMHRSLQILS